MDGRGRMASDGLLRPSPPVTTAPCTPRASAIALTLQTPTSVSSRTNPVLMDWYVSWRSDFRPCSLPSLLNGAYLAPSWAGQQSELSKLFAGNDVPPLGASTTELSDMPFLSAAARVKALKVDPTWNPLPPPYAWSTLKFRTVW